LRAAFGAYATGVTVVSSLARDGTPCGLTSNSFTSLSLDPPLLLTCIDLRSQSLPEIKAGGVFAVNVLAEDQRDVSTTFASRSADKYAGLSWRRETTGAPIIDGTLAWFDCRLEAVYPGGDHEVVVGRVAAFGHDTVRPLGYFRGNYFLPSLDGEHGARPHALFAAIVEHEGRILLRRGAQGRWDLPEASSRAQGGASRLGGLLDMLAAAGVGTTLDFLYSVAERPEAGDALIVYRGQATGVPDLTDPDGWRFVTEPECRELDLASYETRMTIARYFRERRTSNFGLFAATGATGRLAGMQGEPRVYGPGEAEEHEP
jgi:flavin reductase (DIM6/NTAB) family NADH-FMN oxidoreductase RutF